MDPPRASDIGYGRGIAEAAFKYMGYPIAEILRSESLILYGKIYSRGRFAADPHRRERTNKERRMDTMQRVPFGIMEYIA